MLKGHVFSKQLFGNPIFALFINTFLDGNNGISDNYKNGMAVTYSGSTVTVDSGAVCIQGRFLEEDTSTPIAAGTDTAFCKLVIEIDLDKQNTESEFVQGAYKIVKSASAYPELTQTNIVKNNAGIYQYELARFKTSTSGISDFQDMRTFLNFDSIYTAIETEFRGVLGNLKQELAEVEDGSAYVLETEYNKVKRQTLLHSPDENSNVTPAITVEFKRSGNIVECLVQAYIPANSMNTLVTADFLGEFPDWACPEQNLSLTQHNFSDLSALTTRGFISLMIYGTGNVVAMYSNTTDEAIKITGNLTYIVDDDTSYVLGDVDGNGEINEVDLELIRNYAMEKITFTDRQLNSADVTESGNVDSADYVRLKNQLGL